MSYLQPVKQMLTAYGLFLLFIFMVTIVGGCDSGWSIAGWEVK